MSNRVASEPMLFGHTNRFQWMVCIAGMAAFIIGMPSGTAAQQEPIAIVGATIIDGNGGPPLLDGTILIEGERISAVGPRSSVGVPDGTRVIDGAGKYVTPGFIDTNVHMSLAFGRSWTDTNARYWPQHDALVLQGVQQQLKYGITTIRDSYGALLPMKRVKEAIERGEVLGPRMYVAGNIVGWGGPYSETFSGIPESELSLFEEQLNDSITLGSGEEWIHMTPENLRTAVNEYLDFGPDFIKYGGTHHRSSPSPIMFSPRAQRVIIEETHKRGLVVETHATSLEGLRLTIEAGLDLIQHPEVVGYRDITDELVKMIVDRGVVCSLLPNRWTGEEWQLHLKQKREDLEEQAKPFRRAIPKTSAEIRREQEEGDQSPKDSYRRNAEKLIREGCIVSVGTDNLLWGLRAGGAPEFQRERDPVQHHQEPGIGTIIGIEGLVELGMTASEAIVAATKNGAIASKALDEYGTLEVGKMADLLILRADPLADITNIRSLELVIREGQIIDPDILPTNPVTEAWGVARFNDGSDELQ